MNIIFMGTPAFAVPTLEALIQSEHTVVAVYSQPPRPAGRGQKERKSPVQELAEKHNIPVHTPISLKETAEQKIFKNYHADAAVVAAYGLLLPSAILKAPKRGCINVHPSLLPRWRGAAPIQRTIMAGDKETGMCIMQMDEGLDTGAILHQAKIPIEDGTTAGELHDTLAQVGAELVLKTLIDNPSPIPQAREGVTYAKKITKQEAQIDWSKPAKEIRQHILGLSPFPAAYFTYNGESIKVFNAVAEVESSGTPNGTVLDKKLRISCGEGTLQPLYLQRPGKKPMDVKSFLMGFSIPAKTILE